MMKEMVAVVLKAMSLSFTLSNKAMWYIAYKKFKEFWCIGIKAR